MYVSLLSYPLAGNLENMKPCVHFPSSGNTRGTIAFVKSPSQIIHATWKILVSYQTIAYIFPLFEYK